MQRLADETGPAGFEGFDGEILSAQRTPSLTPASVSDSGGVQDLIPVTPSPVDSGVEDGMEDARVVSPPDGAGDDGGAQVDDDGAVDDGMDWD